MLLSHKIDLLFKSPLTDYRIAKDSKVSEPIINKYHRHPYLRKNMALMTAEKLGKYYNKLSKKGRIR